MARCDTANCNRSALLLALVLAAALAGDALAMSQSSVAGVNVLVHCQVNMRASAFVFLYRVIHEDAPVPEAAAKLTGVWIPDGAWKRFIDDTLAAYGKKADIL